MAFDMTLVVIAMVPVSTIMAPLILVDLDIIM